MDKALIIYLLLLAVTVAAIRFAFYCLKKAGGAYFYAAQLTSDQLLSRMLSRKAVLAGNKAAYPIYALSNPTKSMERERLHLTKDRTKKSLEQNFYINCDLTGKKVIVVDDLFTTGCSLLNFKKQIEKKEEKCLMFYFEVSHSKCPTTNSAYT